MKWLFFLASAVFATEYTVTERLFCPISTFDISVDGETIATAYKRLFALTATYDLEDNDSNLLATARGHFFSFGSVADLEDAEGRLLGRIEEYLWKIPPWVEYRLVDAEERWFGTAELNILGNQFDVMRVENPEVLATMNRPLIHFFRDSWTISTTDEIDPRILILLTVFQTDKDNRSRFWSDFKNQLSEELNSYDTRRW
jgi:uncharacterized protein YxjI